MPRFEYSGHHAFLHHTLLCPFPSRMSCFEYPVYGAFVLLLSLTAPLLLIVVQNVKNGIVWYIQK